MSIAAESIDRPLGQHLRRPGDRARRLRFPLSGSDAFAALIAFGLFGGSAALALRDKPWHTPAPALPEAAVAPVAAKTPESDLKPVFAQPTRKGGPAIIRVNPDGAAAQAAGNVLVIRDPAALGQNLRTAHLPDPALIEDSPDGPLPVRAADGRRPFDAYRRPWSGARGARVAIVIGGLGLSQTGTQAAIAELPPEVTLGFAPSGNSLGRWMQAARRDGRELVMQLPLEPFDYPNVDPGRNTLTVDAGGEANASRLHWALARTTNYVGVMNYMGARFTADEAAMRPLMEELGARGLLYLDDGSSARTVAPALAPEARVPLAGADLTIDAAADRGAVLAKLDELERIARARGTALGTGSAFDVTVDAVAQWAHEAKLRGIEIVPVSALAADPGR